VAWTPEELTQFEAIVKNTIGFNEGTDAISVTSLPFTDSGEEEIDNSLYESIEQRQWIMSLVRLSLILGAALLLYWRVLRPITKQVIRPAFLPATEVPPHLLGQRVGDLQALAAQSHAQVQTQLAAGAEPQGAQQAAVPPRAIEGEIAMPDLGDEGLNQSIRQMTQHSPVQAAQILKGWLNETAR
jgi:flagellar biosynthesis/type III secretory pathway M-ring protein FliF/YscJ